MRVLKEQMIRDGWFSAMEAHSAASTAEDQWMTTTVAEEFWNTVNRGYPEATRVNTARDQEIRWILEADLFDPLPRSEVTSKQITLKWVDTNRADDLNPKLQELFGAERHQSPEDG